MMQERPKLSNDSRIKGQEREIKAFSPDKVNIISLSILVLFGAAAIGLFVYPAMSKTYKIKAELNRAQAQLNEKLKLESDLQELIGKFRSDLKLAEEVVFTDKDIATFLENFSDFARKAKMTPVSIRRLGRGPVPVSNESEKELEGINKKKTAKPGEEPKEMKDEVPGLLMHPMEIKIKGGYPQLINFLVSLEGYKQLITVNNLNIDIAREGYPLLEASFIIRLYTMEPPELKDKEEV